MPIDINAWRERIGSFNFTVKKKSSCTLSHTILIPYIFYTFLFTLFLIVAHLFSYIAIVHSNHFLLFGNITFTTDMMIFFFLMLKQLLLFLSGSIELNPGEKNHYKLKVCYYNLNGLKTYNVVKLSSS